MAESKVELPNWDNIATILEFLKLNEKYISDIKDTNSQMWLHTYFSKKKWYSMFNIQVGVDGLELAQFYINELKTSEITNYKEWAMQKMIEFMITKKMITPKPMCLKD